MLVLRKRAPQFAKEFASGAVVATCASAGQ